jgi:hypothetical protein
LLSENDLKVWLQKGIKPTDKILLILASVETPCAVSAIKARATAAGFRIPKTWNISQMLARTSGMAIRVPEGWEISGPGKQHLRNIGVVKLKPGAGHVADGLRAELAKIDDDDTRLLVEEAIGCFEGEFYRAAILMSWIAAMRVLYRFVYNNALDEFNAEATRVDAKWKGARTIDDLGGMKERDFLDRMASVSLIGKNVKAGLVECLARRNGCGHPNSMKVGPSAVDHHIEFLLLNVFRKFQTVSLSHQT